MAALTPSNEHNPAGSDDIQFIRRYKWFIGGAGLAVLLVGFLLFRPDKLFIDDTVDESLADAFGVTEVAASEGTTTTNPPAITSTTAAADGATDGTSTTTTSFSTTTTTVPDALAAFIALVVVLSAATGFIFGNLV